MKKKKSDAFDLGSTSKYWTMLSEKEPKGPP